MANAPEDKGVSIIEIGDMLRQAREKKGLTIEQAQKQTRIHSTVLSALEDGRCDGMLTANYVKSFLKEYSTYLGFDHKQIVGYYLAIHPELRSRNINLGTGRPEDKHSASLAHTIRIVRSVIVFFLVASLVIFLGSKAISFIGKSKAVKKPQSQKYSKAATRTAQPVAVRKSSARNIPFTMTLKVKAQTMVRLRKDGVVLFKSILPKGAEETFSVNNSVNMFIARAEAVEVIVNGQPQQVPGRGVIRDLEVTSNGVRVK